MNSIAVFNVKPDIFLITAVIASLLFNLRWALFFSIFAGTFKDIFSAAGFGVNTLLFPLWCFVILRLKKEMPLDYGIIRLILIFMITFFHNLITGLTLICLGNFIPLGIFLRIVCIGSIYTAAVLPLVFKIFKPAYPTE